MPSLFISYRRADSADATGRIYDRLVAEFGRGQVFKDVDSIPPGRDFRLHVNEMIGDCAAVLAIIGPHWAEARDGAGKRRLDEADDLVRIELEAALTRHIPVVPVLVGHAPMPTAAQLPASLAQLVFHQAIDVRPDPDFHIGATRLVAALRRIMDPSAPVVDAAEDTGAGVRAAAQSEAKLRCRLTWVATIAAVAVLAAAALAVTAFRHLRETPPPETRLDIVTPTTSQPASFALSPDGRQIVYVASGDGVSRLWLRSLASTTAQLLAGTDGANYPFWSPDSRSIGFFAESSLKLLSLGGGAPRTLASAPISRGATWSAEGVILFGQSTGPVMRVAASGGTAAATTLGPQQLSHRNPQFLPDGRRFLFYVQGVPDTTGVYLGTLGGSAPTRLTPADGSGVYLSGWLLWVRAGVLMAQRLDLAKSALTGEPVTLAVGVATVVGRSPVSVAATGLVAYRTGEAGGRQLTWFDRSGTARGIVGDPDGSYSNPRVSPDGHHVVVARTAQGNQDLWLLDGARRTSRFTFDAAVDGVPTWSPDGTRIVFRSSRSGGGDLYQKLTNGTGVEELLLGSDQLKSPWSWSADGHFLLYSATDAKTNGDLAILPMIGDHTPSVFLKTPFRETAGVFSPDGRWVAYQSNESGRTEIYVRPFIPPGAAAKVTGSGGQWQVSTAGGIFPLWRPDGQELYYINPEGAMMAVPIRAAGTTLEPGTPVRLFATRIFSGGADAGQGRQYDVAPDGRFLINTELDSAAAPITLIQNWNPDANKQ